MATTRKAVKRAEELRISQIGDFKHRLGGIMELPSGLVVRTRNPGGLRAFLNNGTIPNSLMVIIERGIKTGKGAKAEELMPDGKMDPQMIEDMTKLMDSIAMKTIVEPKIHPTPTEADLLVWNQNNPEDLLEEVDELRDAMTLYVDELPDDDKQFLFQWISGGTRDLETFRRKLDEHVDDMAAVAGNASNTEPADGTDAG